MASALAGTRYPTLLMLLAAFAGLPAQGKVDWAGLGHAYVKEVGETEPPTLAYLLDRHYVSLLLGDFDVRVPRAQIAKPKGAATIAAIAEALVGLQERLDELTTADAKVLADKREETTALRRYVTAWRSKPATTPAPAGRSRENPCVLILAPDRKTFVGLVGWLGLWKKQYQDYWWNDGTAQFADLHVEDEGEVQLVALEYAAPAQNGNVMLGFDMNTREKTGLQQHVLQRGGMSWCWRSFGPDSDLSFTLGLATALVVDVLGQNNARSGGSNKGSATEGRNAFIPGAPGRGGAMEMVNADSAWRLSQGQDWFTRPLRQAQTAGEHAAKDSKDRLGHFLVRDAKDENKRQVVDGPFLGAAAMARDEVPTQFLDDYLEFHRAYRAGFVHWLQDHGDKTKAASLARFRELMSLFLDKKPGATLDALCEATYGLPLSAKDPATDALERRFLAWLATNSR